MSTKSESRADAGTASSDDRSTNVSRANSVASEDSSDRGIKTKESRNRLRYSYEFLKKLQKSKLSRRPPDCLFTLRQENILRETWRGDRDEKKETTEKDNGVQLDLGMNRRSFQAGCQIANIQPEKTAPKLLGIAKDSPPSKERRIGSGRLGAFKDIRGNRESDYGYGQERERERERDRDRSRRSFDYRKESKPKGRYEPAPREDEPEWFTEGPTSQTDTIELGGFDEKPSKGTTPPPRPSSKPKKECEEKDLSDDVSESLSGPDESDKFSSLGLEQYLLPEPSEDEQSHSSQTGSRFMSKVFAKATQEEQLPKPQPHRQRQQQQQQQPPQEEISSRPVMELLQSAKENNSTSSLLHEMMQVPPLEQLNSLPGAVPPINALDALLNSTHGMSGPPMEMEKGIQGKNLLELLLTGAGGPGAPSPPPPPPQHAKSVEELEADLKMLSRNHMMDAPPARISPINMDRSMVGMPALGSEVLNRTLNSLLAMGGGDLGQPPNPGHEHGLPPLNHFPHQPMQPQLQPPPPPPPQQQQQQTNTHNASHDIIRLLMEGAPSMMSREREQPPPKSAFNQDVKNVPTQVLLREKELLRENGHGGFPRPIVKSNKNPAVPPPPPNATLVTNTVQETNLEMLQRLFEQGQNSHLPSNVSQQAYHAPNNNNNNNNNSNNNNNNMMRDNGPMMRGVMQSPRSYYTQVRQQTNIRDQLFNHQGPPTHSQYQGYQGHVQQNPQQFNGRYPPGVPRPLTGMHGQRYNDMSHYGQHTNGSQQSPLGPEDALAKWFGNLSCNQAPSVPPVPNNVLRAEELERHNRHSKPTAT